MGGAVQVSNGPQDVEGQALEIDDEQRGVATGVGSVIIVPVERNCGPLRNKNEVLVLVVTVPGAHGVLIQWWCADGETLKQFAGFVREGRP